MMLSRIRLLTLPIYALAGLISIHGRILAKFSLWSSKFMNASVFGQGFHPRNDTKEICNRFCLIIDVIISFFRCCLVVFGHVVSQ